MKRAASLLFLAALCGTAGGCREEAMAVEAEDVRVEAGEDHLIVTNGRHEPIYYFALYENDGIMLDWVPCTTERCASVPEQSITRVPYSEVAGLASDVILFYWWAAVRIEPATAGPVHVLRVER